MKQKNKKKQKKNGQMQKPVVKQLLKQQEELRLCISSSIENEILRELKMQYNGILHDIINILNGDKNGELDNLTSEIDK